jgi:Protein of unknown function (DUF1631)
MANFAMPRLGFSDEKVSQKPALRDCIEAVLTQSDGLMGAVFAGLRAIKGQNRGRAVVINQNPEYLNALEELLEEEVAVKATFAAELRGAFYSRRAQDAVAQPLLRFDDFQFLDEMQIDANIESALTQQEVASAVDDVLPALNGLISSLLGLVNVQSQLNPIKPEAFVHALRGCLAAHVQDESARKALVSSAASFLGPALNQLYKDLVNWLRSQGIDPALPVGMLPGAAGPAGVKVAESAISRTLLTLDKLRKLLSGDFELAFGQSSGPKDFLHTVPSSFVALEDMKLVEPMMQRLAKRARKSAAPKLDKPVAVDMLANDTTQGRQLGRQLGSEVVRLMLENLTNDDRMVHKVRQHLKDLEPVLLQLAQSDPRFFSDRQHPARQLLDRITSRSLAFKSESDEGFASFSKTISNAIQVLAGGSGDAASFARVLRKLEDGWEREEEVQRKRLQEAAQALLHAEQRNLLAQKHAEDFAQRALGKEVPDFVTTFLRGPWALVLAESQLRSADGVSDPQGYSQIADDLLWSVQWRLAKRNRAKLVQMVPNLLVKLRQGLQLIDYPAERVPQLFDNLIALHEQAFEVPEEAITDTAPLSASDAPAEGTPSEFASDSRFEGTPSRVMWVGADEAGDSGFVPEDAAASSAFGASPDVVDSVPPGPWVVSDLKVGTWVELMLKGVWVRAQLTWASPHLTLFMFISGKGLAHSMSRRTMDLRREQGLIRVVSDGDVVGSALDAVAHAALLNEPSPVTGPAPLM